MSDADDFKTQIRADLNELKDGVKQTSQTLVDMRLAQSVHSQQLAEHMRRTDLAERRLDLIQAEITPLKEHTAFFATAGKLLGLLGTGVGIAFAVGRMLGRF